MRIITGTLKGRKIAVPADTLIRPTADRTKESIFNIIEVRKHLLDCSVLDLFAGSGNLGFEALSRGAGKVMFVDSASEAVQSITKTAKNFGIESKIHIVCLDVMRYIQGPGVAHDIVFADPPYDYEFMGNLPDVILQNGWLKEDGWFVLEHDKRILFENHPHCVFSKPYGRTIVTIFTPLANS